ncbi:MAG: LacI family DNA-binding transcriptional regulator, partial [Rhizobiales bacterium]|nr:LacI family DNA-binding transcriptional regulator [Hyphomicrobiales bacterium]
MKLKDLADKLGLSQTTVSRALNGYPEVSAATRERVGVCDVS